ncbi:MAG: 50S ribosomal protein L28 [Dehalococcoidia bacterium]|nr:50S ribosomal protein L28 [Dehalococcoidia bacterium]MDW8119651.1 50S ribosomal protein L28 [Chloroflexota bacterium]
MARCALCGKVGRFGRNVSHSNRRTPARWLPNIQRATLLVNGVRRQVAVCTRCLRTQYKQAHA